MVENPRKYPEEKPGAVEEQRAARDFFRPARAKLAKRPSPTMPPHNGRKEA